MSNASNASMIATAGKLSEELVSLSVAARIAGVTRQAVTQHVERGHIGSVAMGANRYVTLADVEKLITQYAMTGRRPKYEEATAARRKILGAVGDKAKRLVRGIIDVMRKRDIAIAAIKDKYALKLEREPSVVERRKLRSLRDRQIRAAKAEYQERLDRLHAIRASLLNGNR